MGLKQLLPALLVALMGFGSQQVMADALSDAFSQGNSMSSGQTSSMFSNINTTTAQANIPAYSTATPAQSGYYDGGNGNIEGPGAAQIPACASATPGTNAQTNEYCDAVNFLATNPSVRPQITISPNDTLLTNSQAISNNPNTILQNNGMSSTGTTSQCVPVTTTTPAQYTTEMCTVTTNVNMTQCVLGRVVNINTNTNYQCNQTINAYQTSTCTRGSVVTVSAGQCTPGTVLASFVKDNACPACNGDWKIKITITCGNDSTYVTEDDWYYPPGINDQSAYQRWGYTAYPTYFVSFITTSSATSSTNFTNKPVFSGGNGCNLTMYLTQLCSGMVCSLAVSENGNCAEGSFTLPAQNIAVPYTVSANFSNDGCATFEAEAQ